MSTSNPELQLAEEFLQFTDCNIFLTGKAGTGKTTFLKNLKENSPKRMVVCAPTGVAAINAGGVTLHSFFQMPFGPFVPGSEAFNQSKQRRFNKEKINIIKSLDLLVIDEISMVRADLLDGIDAVLQRYRRSSLPFGGVQLLMIGDLHQLPPVVKDQEWQILRQHYESAYFFSSKTLRKTEMLTIELKHIYRQSDSRFIDILNSVRDNNISQTRLTELNERYLPDFTPDDKDGYITLCTHNRSADTINLAKLEEITNKTHTFDAEIDGEFPEHTYPTPATLELKIGAQVMFMRNDASPDKLYFNGKIGEITRISGDEIWIKCPEDHNQIIVEAAEWENIEYKLHEESGEIKENKIGIFKQIPLKLAWAITIHKSQGLTFDKAIIDAQAAFAHGQVYVALSRCRTIEGMVLSSSISPRAIKTDRAVLHFTQNNQQTLPNLEKLTTAKIRYQQKLLLECFDFQKLRYLTGRLASDFLGNQSVIQVSGMNDISQFRQGTSEEICAVSENFKRQLLGLFNEQLLPAKDPAIIGRLTKASSYFREKLETNVLSALETLTFDTDNKEIKKRITKTIKLNREESAIKMAAVSSCQSGFSPAEYLRSISKAEIKATKKKERLTKVSYSESDMDHPELFQTLRDWRMETATDEKIAPFQVMHQKTLVQIVIQLPDNPDDLLKVKGIGKQLAERYGDDIISIISSYRKEHNIEAVILPTPDETKADKKIENSPSSDKGTKDITLDLFKTGLTIPEIAKTRSLVHSTIEGHLTFFVSTGEVEVSELLPKEKIARIKQAFEKTPDTPFGDIKKSLGNNYSYGEIKLVQAHILREK